MEHRRVLSVAVLCGLIAPTLDAVADERDTVVVRGGRERPAREPQVAVSPSGQVFVTYGVGNDLYTAASTDGGRTFGPPREVGTGGVLSLGMRRGPRIAATSQAVVIAAIAGAQGKGADGDVVAWRSTDGGQTWSGPRRVSDIDGSAREGLHA